MKKVLVAVAAHADDAELNAGGLMAKWATGGGQVHVVMTTNNCSGFLIPENGDESAKRRFGPAETSRVRNREQDAAAARIGAEVHYLGYNQRHYWNGEREISIGYEPAGPAPEGIAGHPEILIASTEPEHVGRMAGLLERLQPDLVLTQPPLDIDPEHHAVAALVWQAFRLRPTLRRAPLRFWSPSTGSPGGMIDPSYDMIEDISGFFEAKLALCNCHASQMTARRREIVTNRAAAWGRRIGVRYAEPFRTAHWDEAL
jgi:LmbE family N-acetylglucosaminyl deacetylase